MATDYKEIAARYLDEVVRTAQELIRIPSMSFEEKEVAEYIAGKMRELAYDEVVTDDYGSVFGRMRGSGGGSSVTLNCHMDTVDEGDPASWKYPPFSGEVAEGRVWGRGASDTKGTIAIQLYIPHILKKEGLLPKGDVVTAGVVAEEAAGFGAMMQAREKRMLTDYAIVGEATENDIAIGSRGRCAVKVTITGRSCHASRPGDGKNPFDYLAKFLPRLREIKMAHDDIFGDSTMSCTRIESSEKGTNIIPEKIILYVDYRMVGEESEHTVQAAFDKLVESLPMDGITAQAEIVYIPVKTYTGREGRGYQGENPFSVSPDADYIVRVKRAVEEAVGHQLETKEWAFATDTGHFTAQGVKCLGYSPAEIRLCHTKEDSIDIAMMEEGIAGYLAAVTELANTPKP